MPANTRTLAFIKRVTDTFLKDTCTIEKQVDSTDIYGATYPDFVTVDTGVLCRVITAGQGNTPQAQNVGGRESIENATRIICETGTVLDVDYRITTSDGTVWTVVDLEIDRTDENDVQAVVIRAQ
jgi:hypothetical protein